MANLYGKRIDSTYFYILNSDPDTYVITNGNGSDVDWDANKVIVKTGFQEIDGLKNFTTIPTYEGLDILYKNNSLSGLGEGSNEIMQGSEFSAILLGNANTLNGDYSIILAGTSNDLTGNNSAIAVGSSNSLSGYNSFIAAGSNNSLIGENSFMGAGNNNYLSGDDSHLGAGSHNQLIGQLSSISAGTHNIISGDKSYIVGGHGNVVKSDVGAILLGSSNIVHGRNSLVIGGYLNFVSGKMSTVVNGDNNHISGSYSAIIGGLQNKIDHSSFAAIAAGQDNSLSGDTSYLFGGSGNRLSGSNSILMGGGLNRLYSANSILGGGSGNSISGSDYSLLGGGFENTLSGSDYSFLGAGSGNTVSGSENSFLAVGLNNLVEDSPFSYIGTAKNSIINVNSTVISSHIEGTKIVEGGLGANFTKFPFQDIGGFLRFEGQPGPEYTFSQDAGFERVSGYWFEQDFFEAPIYASVLNGLDNQVQSDFSTILNGSGNKLAGANSLIFGLNNRASGHNSYILGGTGNEIKLSFLPNKEAYFEGGYRSNFRNYENYNTIINGKNNLIGSNKAGSQYAVDAIGGDLLKMEAVQNQHSHIFGGEENSIDGINSLILNGKRNDIHAVEYGVKQAFGLQRYGGGNQPISDPPIPELEGVFDDDFIFNPFSQKMTFENFALISSSVRCSTQGSFVSVNNSLNSQIKSGIYPTVNVTPYYGQRVYSMFCNISNSLGASIRGHHYSSIFNGIGNEITTDEERIRGGNATILNGNRNQILDNRGEISATEVTNNTYSTILNGLSNTIDGRRNTIINGADNALAGQNNLIAGERNHIVASSDSSSQTAAFSCVFGEDNLISGVAYLAQNSRDDGNYVFGKRNKLSLVSRSFIFGGYKVFNQGNFLGVDEANKFTLSYDIFCFNNIISSVSGCYESVINNTYYSNVTGAVRSSLSNLYGSDIVNLANSSASNIGNSSTRNVSSSNLNSVEDSHLEDLNRCNVSSLRNSNITGAIDSRIQGYNITSDNHLEFSDVLGRDINATGRVRVENSSIFGERIDFEKIGDTNPVVDFEYCDVLGFGNTLGAQGGSVQNVTLKGYNNNVRQSTRLFVFGSKIDVDSSSRSFFFGEDIESSGESTFIFGNNINSQHVAGSVIKDSKLTPTESKGDDTLFLDFDQGTYLSLPSVTFDEPADFSGRPGSILHSGQFLLIKTGTSTQADQSINWGKIQISSLTD